MRNKSVQFKQLKNLWIKTPPFHEMHALSFELILMGITLNHKPLQFALP